MLLIAKSGLSLLRRLSDAPHPGAPALFQPLSTAALLLSLALLPGCGRGEVQTYIAPKDPAAPPPTASQMAMGQAPDSGPAPVHWKLPQGWLELPPAQMRVGSFSVTGDKDQKAQVSIIPLAGTAGGDLENVNRWRGQVGLGRVDQAGFEKLIEPVQVAGRPGQLFDLVGTPPDENKQMRMLSAVLHRGGTAWFFKMMGDDALVASQKPVFIEFLKNISFDPDGAHAQMAAAPAAAPAPAAASSPGQDGKPAWTVPAGWQEQAPGSMQMAKFTTATAQGGKAEISVVMLAGDAGGTLANVNRWRGQLGLPPVTEAELSKLVTPLDIEGAKASLVDVNAEQSGRRLVAAVVSRAGATWFYKMVGDAAAVAKEKARFVLFVQGVKYGS